MMDIRIPENSARDKVYLVDRQQELSFVVEAGGALNLVLIALPAAGRVTAHVRVALAGEGAACRLYGLFVSGAGEQAEVYTEIEHRAPGCTSVQDFRGVAAGDGRGVFDGLIRVVSDAQRTQASQQNRNLLLSDAASIETRPHLEIYADDIKCSHGATVGQLDPQAVFYLRQRGLDEDEARNLQLYGFVRTIIDRIASPEEAERIDGIVTAKIDRL
jgi:Fe-S cluster assembly protein SufD